MAAGPLDSDTEEAGGYDLAYFVKVIWFTVPMAIIVYLRFFDGHPSTMSSFKRRLYYLSFMSGLLCKFHIGMYGYVTVFFLIVPVLVLFCDNGPSTKSKIEGTLKALGVPEAKILEMGTEVNTVEHFDVVNAHSAYFAELMLNKQYFFKEILNMDGLAKDLAPCAKFEYLLPGAKVYLEGARSDRVYFQWNGCVKLIKPSENDVEYRCLFVLDMFGTEVFLSDPERRRRS